MTIQKSSYSGVNPNDCSLTSITIRAAYCVNIRTAVYYLDGNNVFINSRFCYQQNTIKTDTKVKNLRIFATTKTSATFTWEKPSTGFNFTYEVFCNNVSMTVTDATVFTCPYDSSGKSQVTLLNTNSDIPEFIVSSASLLVDPTCNLKLYFSINLKKYFFIYSTNNELQWEYH